MKLADMLYSQWQRPLNGNVKYVSNKKPVLPTDQKEEGSLLKTKDSFEKKKFSGFH